MIHPMRGPEDRPRGDGVHALRGLAHSLRQRHRLRRPLWFLFNDTVAGVVYYGQADVTIVCFGGPDMRTAFITSSGLGRLYRTRWHCSRLRLNFNA